MSKTGLKIAIAKHSSQLGENLTDQELTDCADDLLSLFILLIEADKDLKKSNESSNNRNTANSD